MRLAFLALLLSFSASAGGLVTRGDLLKKSQTQTTAALNLYVDPTGSDSNACTSTGTAACLTIQGAIDKVPKTILDPVIVTVGAGNFAGAYVAGFTVGKPRSVAAGAYLSLLGTLATSTDLATGSATGTFTSGTAGTSSPAVFGTGVMTGQTWTVNDLRGRFVEVTGGTGSGQIRVVQSNTADTITIAGTWTAVTGTSTFAIRDSVSVVNSGVVVPVQINAVVGTAAIGFVIYDNLAEVGVGTTSALVGVENMRIATANGIQITNTSKSLIRQCQFIVGASGIGIRLLSLSSVALYSSYFDASSGLYGFYSVSSSGPQFLSTSLIRGGIAGLAVSDAGNGFNVLGVAIEASTSYGVWVNGPISKSQFNGVRIDCGGVGTGIAILFGSSNGTMGGSIAGIGGDISNCPTAISATGTHHLSLASVWSGTGNTTAISLTEGAALKLSSTSTITGTTELSIDGTTYTIAQMRALSPKIISNLAHGTRVYE